MAIVKQCQFVQHLNRDLLSMMIWKEAEKFVEKLSSWSGSTCTTRYLLSFTSPVAEAVPWNFFYPSVD